MTHPEIDSSQLVEDASEEDVRSFLIRVLEDNPNLIETFKYYTQKEISLDTMIDDLEGVCDSYSDGYHYIDYEFSRDFCDNYEDTVDKWLDILKKKDQYSLAFKFLLKAYEVFYKLDIEENGAEASALSVIIISQWANIIMGMDDLERLEAFAELGQYFNSMRDYYDTQKILEIFFDCLKGKEFKMLKLDLVKEQLDYIESHDDILNREYALEGFAKKYLELLKKNNASKKEISAVHKKYWDIFLLEWTVSILILIIKNLTRL